MHTEKLAYSIPELAAAAATSRAVLYEQIAASALKTKKIGARTILTADEAMRWLASLPAGQVNAAAS
jgi:hypothetical protein